MGIISIVSSFFTYGFDKRIDYRPVSKIDGSYEPPFKNLLKRQGHKTFSTMPSLVKCPSTGERKGLATLNFSPLSHDFRMKLQNNCLEEVLKLYGR